MAFKHLAPFDPKRDFVCQGFFRAHGIAFERGAPFPGKDEEGNDRPRDPRLEKLLYENHKITFADPDEEEAAKALLPVTMEGKDGGWYDISAPWLDAPEKVQGHDAALLAAQQMRDAGEPSEHHGVALVEGENGWWKVNAAWLEEPESVHGEEPAYERASELRKEGQRAGWEPKTELLGAEGFEANYEIGGGTVELATIIASAQAASGHEAKVWNAMEEADRKVAIQDELDRLTADAATATGGAESGGAGRTESEGGQGGGETGPSEEERITALVDGNTEAQLRTMADRLEGLGTAKTKADIAKLIVVAGRDVKAGNGGPA